MCITICWFEGKLTITTFVLLQVIGLVKVLCDDEVMTILPFDLHT